MPTKTTLKTAFWTIAIIAVVMRTPGRDLLTGEEKFLGIF